MASRSVRASWIEIIYDIKIEFKVASRSVRASWIEISERLEYESDIRVEVREGLVD